MRECIRNGSSIAYMMIYIILINRGRIHRIDMASVSSILSFDSRLVFVISCMLFESSGGNTLLHGMH